MYKTIFTIILLLISGAGIAQIPQIQVKEAFTLDAIPGPVEEVFSEIFRAYIYYPDRLSPARIKAAGVCAILQTSQESKLYVFDEEGNLTGFCKTGGPIKDSATYQYDAENRLIKMEQSLILEGNNMQHTNVTFTYDSPGIIRLKGNRNGADVNEEITISKNENGQVTSILSEKSNGYKVTSRDIFKFFYKPFDQKLIPTPSRIEEVTMFFMNQEGRVTDKVEYFPAMKNYFHLACEKKEENGNTLLLSQKKNGYGYNYRQVFDESGRMLEWVISGNSRENKTIYTWQENQVTLERFGGNGEKGVEVVLTFNEAGMVLHLISSLKGSQGAEVNLEFMNCVDSPSGDR